MPAPPPLRVSSTVRWRSVVQSRKLWTARRTRPFLRAFPTRESSKASRYSGKMLTTSMPKFGCTVLMVLLVVFQFQNICQKAGRRVDLHDTGGIINFGHNFCYELNQGLGSRWFAHDQRVLGRQMLQPDNFSDRFARDEFDVQPVEFVGVPRVFLILFRRIDQQLHTPQLFGSGAVGHIDEGREPAAGVLPASADREGSPIRGAKFFSDCEALFGNIGAQFECNVALQTVGARYYRDDEFHSGALLQRSRST